MGAEAKANRSKYRVELMPHRNPEMGRFGNSELFPLLRSELDTCRAAGKAAHNAAATAAAQLQRAQLQLFASQDANFSPINFKAV